MFLFNASKFRLSIRNVCSDRGLEFSRQFSEALAGRGIHHFTTQAGSLSKASPAERSHRTARVLLGRLKAITGRVDLPWLLSEVERIMNRVMLNKFSGKSPEETNESDGPRFLTSLMKERAKILDKFPITSEASFRVGDKVMVRDTTKVLDPFIKSHKSKFHPGSFVIQGVSPADPLERYVVGRSMGDSLPGTYPPNLLAGVDESLSTSVIGEALLRHAPSAPGPPTLVGRSAREKIAYMTRAKTRQLISPPPVSSMGRYNLRSGGRV